MIKLEKNETVVFLGDSITDGNRGRTMDLNHIFGHGFAEMICSRLGVDNYENMPKFINKGVSGESITQIYARLGKDCLAYKPSIISILAGVNDAGDLSAGLTEDMIVRRYFETLERLIRDAREILSRVKIIICEPFYAKVAYCGDPYENLPHPYCEKYFEFSNIEQDEEITNRYLSCVKKLQKELPSFCSKFNVIFVPLQDKFNSAALKTDMSYFIWDNIHPTMVGHRLIADRWFEIMENKLNNR